MQKQKNPVDWYLISGEGDCGEGDCGEGDCGEGDCGEGEWIPHFTPHIYTHTSYWSIMWLKPTSM